MKKHIKKGKIEEARKWKLRQNFLRKPAFSHILPIDYGHEQCKPGHSWDEVRQFSLIHYVYSGKGTFEKDGKVYNLSRGDAFLINEGEENYYCADIDDPWHCFWISFSSDSFGGKFRDLQCPVFKIKTESIFTETIERAECGSITPEFVISKLYLLYDEVFNKPRRMAPDVATEAVIYINQNFARNISVAEIADFFGLERSYFSRLFKKKHGISVQNYIINLRMNKASELLKKGVSVKETAFLIGYEDAFAFSKMYKKTYGESPRAAHIKADYE